MVSLALATLLAGTPPVETPTFCERMAARWGMGHFNRGGRRVYVARLKGQRDHTLIYSFTGEVTPSNRAAVENVCQVGDRRVFCDVIGPGVLEVRTRRATRRFEVRPGERARFASGGKIVNCEDYPPVPPTPETEGVA